MYRSSRPNAFRAEDPSYRSVTGTVAASRIGSLDDHCTSWPDHPSGRSMWMPNSSNASVTFGGGGTTRRAISWFAADTMALLGSLVPNSAVTLIHHPFTDAFTTDSERSSRVCPSHP